MENSRRDFLKTVAIGFLGAEVATGVPTGAIAQDKSGSEGIEIQRGYTVFDPKVQKTMEAFAEIILPGSQEFGMNERIMEYVNRDTGAATFFDAGFWNVNALSMQQFDKPFYEIENEEDKLKIVRHVSVRNKRFFNQFKYLAMRIYYQDQGVWKSLGYNGPPQPKGFMDYTEPPKSAK